MVAATYITMFGYVVFQGKFALFGLIKIVFQNVLDAAVTGSVMAAPSPAGQFYTLLRIQLGET